MAFAELNHDRDNFSTDKDSIVIVDNLQSIRGGRTLDVTGFAPKVIHAGHVIIKGADGEYRPMPLNGGATAYGALPAGAAYVGISINSVRKNKAMVGILVRGTVNPVAAPYGLSAASILPAVKAALPLIDFRAD